MHRAQQQPGPNMIYLTLRFINHGWRVGFMSLAGVAAGFLFYMLCTALRITAFVVAVACEYDVLQFAGAAYLVYLRGRRVARRALGVCHA